MSQQPEAIRLAAVCDLGHPLEDDVVLIGAELRRLHAVESGAKVELMRRDNLIDSLHGLCESYRTQVERLEADPRIGKCQACGHECEACRLQNASQTPQTDLSLMAAPQEWSPAYTRGPARQSAPVAAVPAMVQLTEEQMISAVRPLCNTDQVAERLVAVSIDEYRAIEAASARLNDLAVGDGAQPIKDTP